jgi:type IV secretory pathway TraG/TraD family ATPase VirD4
VVLPPMQLGYQAQHLYRKQVPGVPVNNPARFTHTWVLGKSGAGKTTALLRWAIDDILAGDGVAFFDLHGDAARELLAYIPPARRGDVLYYDPSDREYPIGFNVLDRVPEAQKAFVASSVVDTFKSIWGHSWGPQLELFLYASTAALLDVPNGTLLGIKFLLTSPTYRRHVLTHVRDPAIREFWETDFAKHMPEREQRERTLSTLNKIGALVSDPLIRNSIGQPRSALDLRDILDTQKILIVALPQGQLSITKASLIGALVLSNLHLTALGRSHRSPFHVYIDECHHFGTATLTEMLSGIRKFGVSLVLGHQYIDQVPECFRAALIGTVGTTVAFRVGVNDAAILSEEFGLNREDVPLTQLAPFRAYAKTDRATYYLRMPPSRERQYPASPAKILNAARHRFGVPRSNVESRIGRFIANT